MNGMTVELCLIPVCGVKIVLMIANLRYDKAPEDCINEDAPSVIHHFFYFSFLRGFKDKHLRNFP